MGKACTKHLIETHTDRHSVVSAPPVIRSAERQRTRPSSLQHLLKLSLPDGDQIIKPPHALRGAVHELSTAFKFFVCICGLRIKHIGRYLDKRTHRTRSLAGPEAPSSSHNYVPGWRSSSAAYDLTCTATEYMIVLDWDNGFKTRRTACVKPENGQVVFRDSFFFCWEVESMPRFSESKLLLSVYVVEHGRVQEELNTLELDIFSIATGPVQTDLPLLNAQRLSSSRLNTDSRHRTRVRDARLQLDVRMSQICELLITPVEVMAHLNATYDPAAPNDASVSSSSHVDGSPVDVLTSPAPLRSKSVTELDKVKTGSDAGAKPGAKPAASPAASEEIEGDQIQRAAAGGHSLEDDRRPLLAEWQVDYAPTGIQEPAVFASTWTSVTSTPAWCSIQSDPEQSVTLKQSCEAMDVRRAISSDVAWRRGRDGSGAATHRPFGGLSPCCETEPELAFEPPDTLRSLCNSTGAKTLSLQPISQRDDSSTTASTAGSVDTAPPRLRLSAVARHGLLPVNPAAQNPFLHTSGWSRMQGSAGIAADKSPALVCSLPSGVSAQQKYTSLAAGCRMGRPIGQVLPQGCFPTVYLVTTGESLRQFHIHLRLWARHLGVGAPKLAGETWVPFFKLYEADVVEQGDRYFYDARFQETLWQEGRSVGSIEGLIVFQNSPMIRQMMAGVHTELGFSRIAMPILGELGDHNSEARKYLPREILQLFFLQHQLTNLLYSKSANLNPDPVNRPALTAQQRAKSLQDVCEQMHSLLTNNKTAPDMLIYRATFVYDNITAMVNGQRVLLELAKHVLDTIEQVPWHIRGIYCSILLAVMRRAELEMGNLLPRIPECASRSTDLDLRSLTRLARKLEREGTVAESLCQLTLSQEDETQTPEAGRSPARIMHVLSMLRGRPVRLRLRSGPRRKPTTRSDMIWSESIKDSNEQQLPILSLSSLSTDTQEMNHPEELSVSFSPSHALRSASLSREASSSTAEQADESHREATAFADGTDARDQPRRTHVSLTADEIHDLVTYHKRMRIAKLYAIVLLRLRRYCLSRICSEALFESQRKDVCLFLALIYTRLPSFRERFLARILTEDERAATIAGWRGHEFSLDKESLDEHDNWLSRNFPGLYELQIPFDWSPFHLAIRDYFGIDSEEELIEASEEPSTDDIEWESRLCHPRGILFFTFLEKWVRSTWHMIQCQTRYPAESGRGQSLSRGAMNVRWDLLPGYATMLKAFLIEMRLRPIAKFPDALLNCSGALLANDKLLSVFTRIVLSRTSVFCREQVFAVFNYLDFWLEVMSVTGRAVPATYDFRFLCKALETVLTSDLALQTAKGIWFIYKRVDFVSAPKMLPQLIDLLIYRKFHELLLSWSWLVRKCYIYFLLYRLCETTRRIVAKYSSSTSKAGNPSSEDRLYCWAYVLLSRNLNALGLPNVFGNQFLDKNVRHLLARPLPDRPSPFDYHSPPHVVVECNTVIWNAPAVLPSVATRSPQSTLESLSRTPQPGHVLPSALGSLDEDKVSLQVNTDFLDSCHAASTARTGWTHRPGFKRFRRRKSYRDRSDDDLDEITPKNGHNYDCDDDQQRVADPHHFLPPPLTPTPRQTPYHKAVLQEFEKELRSYKLWMISDLAEARQVPPMHIPASPLDTDVEGYLDDD